MLRLKIPVFEGVLGRLIRLGLVLHTSSSGNIIVKVENLPRIGDRVVDENLNHVGEVFDILGPVSAPYAAIRPKTKLGILPNKPLYVLPRKK